MKLFAPAKLNLFLNVLRKRKDGYHELETLFERVGLVDTLHLKLSATGITVRSKGEKVPSGPANLAYRAAALLKDHCGVRKGVVIFIQKKIPVAAGLGGGSSDAAAVLLGLNRLWKLGLTKARLMALGATLGSDVPFFILESPFAMGTGRGEILRKVPASRRKFWHVIVKPPFGISTKEAYKGLKPPFLTLPKAGVRMLVHSIQKGDVEPLAGLLTNSLEVTLNKRVTTIEKLKNRLLREGALGALLSGSGSAVFGLFSSKHEAVRATGRLRKIDPSWKVFTAATY